MRTRLSRVVLTLGLSIVAVVAARSARAGPEPASRAPPEIDFAYEAPPGCPARRELVDQIRRRIPRAWRARADRRSFVVQIEHLRSGEFSGRLTVSRMGHAPQSRDFRGGTCKEVSSALAVFMVIALDPTTDDEIDADADDDAVTEREPAPTPTTETVGSSPVVPKPPSVPKATVVRARPSSPRRDGWVWTSAVSLVYQRVPLDAWGSRVEAQLARRFGHDGFARRIAPALRLSWGFSDFSERLSDAGEAHFRLETARGTACARIDLAPLPLSIAPCLGVEVGSLEASSRDIRQVGQIAARWSAMTGLLRVAWKLSPWLSLETELGAEAPLGRPSFALGEPFRMVYRPPPVLLTTGIGLAVSAQFR